MFKSKLKLAIMFTTEVGLTLIAQVHTQFVWNKSSLVTQSSIVLGTWIKAGTAEESRLLNC